METIRNVNENERVSSETLSRVASEEFETLHIPSAVEHPYLLLFGGFQGSGKTTTIQNLTKEIDVCTISHDRLRQNFLNKTGSLPDSQKVNTIKTLLLGKVFPLNVSIVIDANSTPASIGSMRALISELQMQHKIISIFLDVQPDTLRSRVIQRVGNTNLGMHLGTLQELEKTMRDLGSVDKSSYNFVLNTEILSLDGITQEVKRIILENI